MSSIDIDISKVICSTFDKPFKGIVNNEYDKIVLKGGRSTTKSQTTSEAIITGCMVNRASAVAIVRYSNGIENRLVNTFLASLDILGVSSFWKLKKSPFELILLDKPNGRPTNVSIKFTGCDEENKLKSFRSRDSKGFRYVWFEEVTDFESLSKVNNVIDTMARGQGKHTVILTYNPPRSTNNWCNKEFNVSVGQAIGYDTNWVESEYSFKIDGEDKTLKQLIHHSTYLDVIDSGHSDWLGSTFIGEAERHKEFNNDYYRWNYLGEAIGTEGNVFNNIRVLDTDNFTKDMIDRGLDFGFTNDPSAYVEWVYDKKAHSIYCVAEYVEKGADNSTLAFNIKQLNKNNFKVWCDGAEPRTINELIKLGIRAVPYKKGPDSIRFGIKWLQSLNSIYINPRTCPKTYKEFTEYEYKLNKQGEYTGELGDTNNHTIDATRYALNLRML